eukprot:6944883-Alexandrium_andersonii.AAC.1
MNTTYSGLRAVRNEPTMREQFTRSGAVTEVMHAAIQRDEAAPRRDLVRVNVDHSEPRHLRMNT